MAYFDDYSKAATTIIVTQNPNKEPICKCDWKIVRIGKHDSHCSWIIWKRKMDKKERDDRRARGGWWL